MSGIVDCIEVKNEFFQHALPGLHADGHIDRTLLQLPDAGDNLLVMICHWLPPV